MIFPLPPDPAAADASEIAVVRRIRRAGYRDPHIRQQVIVRVASPQQSRIRMVGSAITKIVIDCD